LTHLAFIASSRTNINRPLHSGQNLMSDNHNTQSEKQPENPLPSSEKKYSCQRKVPICRLNLSPISHTSNLHLIWTSSAIAAGVTSAITHPFSSTLSKSIADNMRLPHPADIAFGGMNTAFAKAMTQTGLVECLKPQLLLLADSVITLLQPHTSRQSQQLHISSQVLSTLATNMAVALIVSPIEILAMNQNQQGISLLQSAQHLLKQNPGMLLSTLKSTFISLNITWFLRLYAQMQAKGNRHKEKEINAKLTTYASPIKSWLKCVNARQLIHKESFLIAAMAATQAMIKKPFHAITLIALNTLLAAYIGHTIYFGIREKLHSSFTHKHFSPSLERVNVFKGGLSPTA